MLIERVFLVSKRFFGVPRFFNYVIADGFYNLLYPDKPALRGVKTEILAWMISICVFASDKIQQTLEKYILTYLKYLL